MPNLEFSPAVQQWVNVVLIWIGLGTVAGLLAKLVIPIRDPAGSIATLLAGILGSTLGLGAISVIFHDRQIKPISPLGFAAAAIGAFVLLIFYRIFHAVRPKDEKKKTKEAEEE